MMGGLTRWLAPFAALFFAAALPWAGALIPLWLPTHFANGVMAACVIGICVFVRLLVRSTAAISGAALALGVAAFAYLLGLAILERIMPSGGWESVGVMRALADVLFTDESAAVSMCLFAGLALLLAITNRWMIWKGKRTAVTRDLGWPVHALVIAFSWIWLLAGAAGVGKATHDLGAYVFTRQKFSSLLIAMEDGLGMNLVSDNEYMRATLKDEYLFASRIPWNDARLTGPGDIAAMMTRIGDRFSHTGVGNRAPMSSFSTGLMVGVRADDSYRVTYVYPSSPADLAGIERGQEVILCRPGAERIKECGKPEDRRLVLAVARKDGSRERLVLDYRSLPNAFVPIHGVIALNERKVGYVLFNEFDAKVAAEFDRVARKLKAKGITDLVVDLRLNGGGERSAMATIASTIPSAQVRLRPLGNVAHIDRYRRLDGDVPFPTLHWDGLGLKRVIFLVSRSTASASEILIMALKSHIDVVTIGETTVGKGMGCTEYQRSGWRFCFLDSEYLKFNEMLVPPSGIKPDIHVKDDFRLPLGDPQEPLLKAALEYLESN